jgi:predicted nucleic acid-binding protein
VAYYVDTSAVARLVVREPQTATLRRWLGRHDESLVSSDITRTELIRATRRVAPDRVREARAVLDAIVLARVTPEICDVAALLDPAALRSLDAIHLATALMLGDELDGIVVYDNRLREAVTSVGIETISPGG